MPPIYFVIFISFAIITALLMAFFSQRKQRKEALSESKSIQEDLEITVSNLNQELKDLRDRYAILVDLDEEKSNLAVEEIGQLKFSRDLMLNETKNILRKQVLLLITIYAQKKLLAKETETSQLTRETLETTIFRLSDELNKLGERYVDIIDIESEKNKLNKELDDLRLASHQKLIDSNNQLKALNDEYIAAKKIFDHLNTEILKLEENLDISSFGLYKPHYNYDTPESYKVELEKIIDQAKLAIKSDNAIICTTKWEVNGSIVQGRKMTRHYSKIMLRAFNGECDAAVLKVRWNNVTNMEERILKSFEAINKLGETHSISVTNNYLELKMKELRLTYEYQEKLHEEKDEQRRIRELLREEERSLREIEKARQEAEKEEIRYAKALQKAREDLSGASEMEVDDLRNKIHDLEIHLKNAQELKERAISMAQITKAGHVYIISNIGSFGDNVYKIGMTRRMEPSDRVRELSGASVPFSFDIHAMIYSENAPELENKFHKKFAYNRLNLNNNRKEFFNITLDDIENFAHENGHVVEFTKMAEARDYRQTHAIRNVKSKAEIEAEMSQIFPDQLIDTDDEDDNGEV